MNKKYITSAEYFTREDIAKNIIHEGRSDIRFIAEVTGLLEQEIEKLKNQLDT